MSDTTVPLGSDGFPLRSPAGVPTPAAPEPVAPAPPKPRFVSGLELEAKVMLGFPIEYDGKVYDAVTVRRLTIGTLAEFLEARGEEPRAAPVFRYPIYFDAGGAPMPDVVMDALEMSDHAKIRAATDRFLPPGLMGAGA